MVDMKVMTAAVMLVKIWNCRNLQTVLLTQRPRIITFTVKAKLSSTRIVSEASLGTSVLVIPIDNLMLAVLRARASFALSPVTPVISPSGRRDSPRIFSSSREDGTQPTRQMCSRAEDTLEVEISPIPREHWLRSEHTCHVVKR